MTLPSLAHAWLEPLANHLWQSSLLLLAVAVLVRLLHQQRAQVRYWLWLVASLKFLVPFSWLAAAGHLLPAPAAAPSLPSLVQPLNAIAGPFTQWTVLETLPSTAATSSWTGVLPAALLALWGVGIVMVSAAWTRRWWSVAAVMTAGDPAVDGRELERLRTLEARLGMRQTLPLVRSQALIEPGVFGVIRPVLLWPSRISDHLDDEQVDAILAHELSHVRRRDNLAAMAHMTAQALFWFHPLVWWLGRRLIDERERACDEAVLNMGSDPDTYAEGILQTCRVQVEAPLACVAGVTGGDLTRRIARIMTHQPGQGTSPWLAAALAVAAAAVVIAPVMAGAIRPQAFAGTMQSMTHTESGARASLTGTGSTAVLIGPTLHAYQWQRLLISLFAGDGGAAAPAAPQNPPASAELAFEVASIKENKSPSPERRIGLQPGGRFTAMNIPARDLITFAYGIQRAQMEGGPDWLDTARFDIVAKAPDGQAFPPPAPGDVSGPMNLMMRALLADRFRLAVEQVSRDLPIYELVRARADGRLGPGLEAAADDCRQTVGARGTASGPSPPPSPAIPPAPGERPPCGMMMSPVSILAGNQPVAQLTRILTQRVGRPVIDRTGLTGNYSFTLEFAPDPGFAPGPPPPGAPAIVADPDKPSLFAALQEQLGLKLEAKRGPVDVLVVKSMTMPTPD